MNDAPENVELGEELPKAKVTRRKWNLSVIWIVPLDRKSVV